MEQPLWKTVWQSLTKLHMLLPLTQQSLLDIYPNELKMYVHTKNVHVDVYSNFIHNCQNLEATKMSFRR